MQPRPFPTPGGNAEPLPERDQRNPHADLRRNSQRTTALNDPSSILILIQATNPRAETATRKNFPDAAKSTRSRLTDSIPPRKELVHSTAFKEWLHFGIRVARREVSNREYNKAGRPWEDCRRNRAERARNAVHKFQVIPWKSLSILFRSRCAVALGFRGPDQPAGHLSLSS